MKNIDKIYALANALADCGIESEIAESKDATVLSLAAFNCEKGGNIIIEIAYLADAEEGESAELVAYEEEMLEKMLEKLD